MNAGDIWTTLHTGKVAPSKRTRKVELTKQGDLTGEDLRVLMRQRPARWWQMYVYAKDGHLVIQFWNRRHEG